MGDIFTGKSVEYFYVRNHSDETYGDQNYQMHAYATDEFSTFETSAASRIRNNFVAALNGAKRTPKVVCIVPENDVARNIKLGNAEITEKLLYKVFNKISKWLVREFARLLEAYLEVVPVKSKTKQGPILVWILPTQHKNYQDNWERHIFARCLSTAVKGKRNMISLELKQLWDEYDGNIFLKESRRYSDIGYKTFWLAVDRSIQFAVSLKEKQDNQYRGQFFNSFGEFGRGGRHPFGGRRPFGSRRGGGRGRSQFVFKRDFGTED